MSKCCGVAVRQWVHGDPTTERSADPLTPSPRAHTHRVEAVRVGGVPRGHEAAEVVLALPEGDAVPAAAHALLRPEPRTRRLHLHLV